MSTTIVSTIQQIIRHEMRTMRVAELGLVEAVYPHSADGDSDNYGCDVRLKDSELLLKRVPIATGHIGTVAIPNVGDLVLVTFDQGDIDQPIVIGRFYNDEDRPPLNNPNEVIFRLPLAEADDKTILADIRNLPDNNPPREMLLRMPPKITLQINDGTVHALAGKTEMTLDQTNETGGKVTVLAGNTKIIMDQDGDITIDAAGSMTIKAAQDLSLEAFNIDIKANSKVSITANSNAELSGMMLKLEGTSSAALKGSALTEISGGLVKIN